MTRAAMAISRGWHRLMDLPVARVRRHLPSLLLAAVAASVSFLIASTAFGTEDAFFAPIAAVVCVGITAGHRIRRAIEITIGVALGLTAADLLARLIGFGWIQLGVAVLLATAAAVALQAGQLMSNQAAVAAILVVALSPGEGNPWVRLGDALIGGAVALALNTLAAPAPERVVTRIAQELIDDYTAVLAQVSAALASSDLHEAELALELSDRAGARLSDLDEALAAARDTARLGRHRRRLLRSLQPLLALRGRAELIIVTVRSLARASANAVRHGRAVDDRLIAAVDDLSASLVELGRWIGGETSADAARDRALQAAREASTLLREPHPRTTDVIIVHLRSGAIDILRATGIDQGDAVAALERAAGRADDKA
jgi:uncharacterized membrane protein YgaE (UPF0421/DUF939 family)